MKGSWVVSWWLWLLALSAVALPVRAELSSEGREFWVCFQRNHEQSGGDTLTLMLFLTSRWEARVRVSSVGLGLDTLVRIPARAIVSLPLPQRAEVRSWGRVEYLAIHVEADTPIAVYGLNRRRQSTDTYMALPVSVLGTEYRVMSYRRLSASFVPQVAIVGVFDSTEVVVMPAEAWADKVPAQAGDGFARPLRVLLHRGQVYQLVGPAVGEPSDITGMLIRSSRPVAVFSGHVCAYVPLTVPACNHLVEQLPPVQTWGRHYYVGKLRWRSRYVVRVLAHYPNTQLFLNDRPIRKLDAGEFWEQTFTENVQVTADKPILVAQFSEGYQNGDSIGDPMMLLLTPTQQFLTHYRFATPVQGAWRHFVNVIIPLAATASLRFDGAPVRGTFERIGESQYALVQLEIPYGSHTIEASEQFGLYAYGFGYGPDSYDAYGNPVGQAFRDIEQQHDVLPPVAEITNAAGVVSVVVRDDRPTDRGLQEVRVVRSENLQGTLPAITPGVLRAEARFAPVEPRRNGYAVLLLTDMAGNRATVTLCYSYDLRQERFVFILCEGEQQECMPPMRLWFAGGYIRLANVRHAAAVPRTGNLPPMNGVFGAATGWAGVGGVFAGVRFSPLWGALVRVGIETYGGKLAAPDTLLQNVRQPDGTVTAFQEERLLSLQAPYLSLGIGGTWYGVPGIYVQGELSLHMRLGSAITLERRILQPPGYVYSQTQTPVLQEPVTSFSALRRFYGSASLVVGTHYRLGTDWRLCLEGFYTHGLTELVSAGQWRLYQLGVRLGVLHRWWR
jgi:hypothetical protein